MASAKQILIDENKASAKNRLLDVLKKGATIYCIASKPTPKGFYITLLTVKNGEIRNLNYDVSMFREGRARHYEKGVFIQGGGMDMGFAIVCNLSYWLFDDRSDYHFKHYWL